MLVWLWQHRERPRIASAHWWKVWAKRVALALSLLRTILRQSSLRFKGARIDTPAFISPALFNGKLSNLEIQSRSFVGRVEMHLHDKIHIGSNVVINDGVRLLTASHVVNDANFRQITAPIFIGDYAWISTGAMLLPGVSIGTGAVVGAGALVTKDVPAYGVVVGNPGRLVETGRTTDLQYNPLRFVASYEAWLGSEAPLAIPSGAHSTAHCS
jgi:maltose O-acetyltransferase